MAKKLNDPSKENKNLGTNQRGLGMPINSEPELSQKKKYQAKNSTPRVYTVGYFCRRAKYTKSSHLLKT